MQLDEILPCFFDMPLSDATKILRVSSHSIIKNRKRMGLSRWPFDEVKRGCFKMNWNEIRALREEKLASADGETKEVLKAAEKRGWLMAKIHDRTAKDEEGILGLESVDALFDGQDGETLLDSSQLEDAQGRPPQSDAEEPQEEPVFDQPLQLDFGDAQEPENCNYVIQEDDAEQWGLLGFGDVDYD